MWQVQGGRVSVFSYCFSKHLLGLGAQDGGVELIRLCHGEVVVIGQQDRDESAGQTCSNLVGQGGICEGTHRVILPRSVTELSRTKHATCWESF